MKNKLLLIAWLLILSSCNSLPPPPSGSLCIVDEGSREAYCSSIPEAVAGQMPIHTTVPITGMDKYVCFSPESYRNIQAYIQKLKRLAQQQCQP